MTAQSRRGVSVFSFHRCLRAYRQREIGAAQLLLCVALVVGASVAAIPRYEVFVASPPEFRESFQVNGQPVTIRTMHPQDREIEDQFVRSLSKESRYYRFHGALRELTPYMLERFTHLDYPGEMALIATVPDGETEKQIGVVRYARTNVPDRAEVAIVVADAWQGMGIGSRMMTALREIAREAGFQELEVNILRENRRMLGLARHLGYLKGPDSTGSTSLELGKGISPKNQ